MAAPMADAKLLQSIQELYIYADQTMQRVGNAAFQ